LKTILDSSALINWSNGRVLEPMLRLPGWTFAVCPQVIIECDGQAEELKWASANGLARLDDDSVPASLFLELLNEFRLGLGETECLAFAIHEGYSICCDDRKAREVCRLKVGEQRVIGSLGLLRMCVEKRILTREDATTAYELMKSKGGFLPQLLTGYFGT
jgi:predicted nucleic acid-binding protein